MALAPRAAAGLSLEEAALETHIAMQRARARREPMGGATVILFVLRLRQELDRLRRIVWATALEAPLDVRAPSGSMA